MSKANNFGWYIIPFTIKEKCEKDFVNFLNNEYKESKEFKGCKYLFSYIDSLYNDEFSRVKTYAVPKEKVNISLNSENISDDQISFEKTMIVKFSNYMGFICYKVNYKDLTIDEIIDVSYHIRNGCDENNGFELFKVSKELLNEKYTIPFFYTSSDAANTCSLLQKVTFDCEKSNENSQDQYYLLGRGYRNTYSRSGTTFEDSEVDIQFCPYSYIEWRGCQSVLAAFPNTYNLDKTQEFSSYSFIKKVFPISVENDYFAMYLFLLNQRYSLMYLLSKLTLTNEDDKLNEIEEMLNEFKVYYSFKTISNEMTYQNLYDKMYKVLGIDQLINDVQDASERLAVKARKDDEAREKRTNKLLGVVTLLALGSALIDIADYLDRAFPQGERVLLGNTIASGVIVVLVLVFGIVSMYHKGIKKLMKKIFNKRK